MSDGTDGWGGFVTLDGVELAEVVEFAIPDDETEEVEYTHLKSPGKRREFKAGMIDGGTVDVQMNYVAGSPTDIKFRALKTSQAVVPIVFTIPDDNGDPAWEITTSTFVKGYSRGPVNQGKITAVARCRITGAQSEAAA